MATKKKMLEAAAGAAGGASLDITDVFSTYLYEGTGAALTITNGIDLSGEGGLVWLKNRGTVSNNSLHDTERTPSYQLVSNSTAAEDTLYGDLSSFNNDGFSLGTGGGGNNVYGSITSWTFRKAPKFFDVVTYSGNGANRSISHSLGSEPGMIIIKRTDASESWIVYHRSAEGTGTYWSKLELESTGAEYGGTRLWGAGTGEDHTDSTFFVSNAGQVNASNGTFVAYLFAHNDSGDGEFGPDSDQDIIKCGSFVTTTGTVDVDLGFEPQFVLMKSSTTTDNWAIVDTMRGWVDNSGTNKLSANTSGATEGSVAFVTLTSTGFKAIYPTSGLALIETYIYMAIRRGPLNPPTAGTEVFAINTAGSPSSEPSFTGGFVTDMSFNKFTTLSTDTYFQSRMQGPEYLKANTNSAATVATSRTWDYMDGWGKSQGTDSRNHSWMWKRAPSFSDVVAYKGAYGGLTISHNLGAVPEMMWVKARTGTNNIDWAVYHKDLATDAYLFLNQSVATQGPRTTIWSDTRPSDSVFYAGGTTQDLYTSNNGYTYIAYLFATLAGVSKVGSVTHSGTTNVDCGFSAGARLVILKRTDAAGDWYVWDSVRGIIAGNDPYLLLNTAAAQVTNTDYIDPLSSGFTITSTFTAGDYIFYAIA